VLTNRSNFARWSHGCGVTLTLELPRGGNADHRRAFTLIELLLVLVILVVVASAAAPILHRSFAGQRLKKSGDMIRGELGRARTRAIETGQVYAFYLAPGGNSYQIAPYSYSPSAASTLGNTYTIGEVNQLPDGIMFLGQSMDPQSTSGAPAADRNSMRPILFYPDGTSQHAEILLADDKGSALTIELRGLTGMSKLSDLKTIDEVASAGRGGRR
jgi:prepilin-type N-terminal cleavage/methylation domain-containing protein